MKKKLWIVTGEPSGDLFASYIVEQLYKLIPDINITGMASSKVDDKGVQLLIDSSDFGVTGIWEVLKKYGMFKKALLKLFNEAMLNPPDIVILVDYPGFNLRLAAKLKKKNKKIKIFYFISPQVWAWKEDRISFIDKVVDQMFVIWPFEVDAYKNVDLNVKFVGHPLVPIIDNKYKDVQKDDKLIVLLPGSRNNEIKRLFLTIYKSALVFQKKHPEFRFILPIAKESLRVLIEKIITIIDPDRELKLELTNDDSRDVISRSCAGIAASGTVTVEACLLKVPLVSIYRISALSYLFVNLKVDYFSMPNILLNKELFTEYKQGEIKVSKIVLELEKIIIGGSRRKEVEDGMNEIEKMIYTEDNCYLKIAQEVDKAFKEKEIKEKK